MDIKFHEDKITALESRIECLFSLASTIESAGGMNKAFALEALDILPEFGNNLSIAYYTKDLTITQYHASLEELSGGVWALLIAAGAALIAMVYKFIDWLFPSKSSNTSTYTNLIKADERQKDASTLVSELNLALKNANRTQAGGVSTEDFSGIKFHSIDELLNNYIEREGKGTELDRMLRIEDPFFYDIINHKDYSKTIKSLGGALIHLPSDVIKSSDHYLNLVNTSVANIKSLRASDADEVPIDIFQFPVMLDMFGRGEDITIGDGVAHINEIKNATKEIVLSGAKIQFTKLNSLVSTAINATDITKILKKVESMEEDLCRLRTTLWTANDKVEKASLGDSLDKLMRDYTHALKDAFKITRTDVIDCLRFFKEIIDYANLLLRISARVESVQKAAFRVIEDELKKNIGYVPDNVKEICKRFNKETSYGH